MKSPDKDNWGKLTRVLKYLNGTKYLKLSISVAILWIFKSYVDGLHNVHWYCKGHVGAIFTMGEGAVSGYSRKVKLNTRSSTKTEIVVADMYMPEMLWSLYFIESQGYEVECMGLHQDNTNTQLLMKNGRLLSGKKTKHIRAKFFFINDRINDGEMIVVNCPTEGMWADILMKLLQGKAFRVIRSTLMNCDKDYFGEEETGEEFKQKASQWLGEYTNMGPPNHCRSVLGDLQYPGDQRQWTEDC